ncbi:hypothetical protein [Arthrobacter sp. V1I9]|nr:hypothetical protein [Arthrobacter sp. V1I9]
MAISEFAFALTALLGTLLVPFAVLHQMLRLKRRAVRITAPAAPRGNSR